MKKNKLIIVPYAYGGITGASIQNIENQLVIYIKNSCVACISAKHNAGDDTDVMLVSNIQIPNPYSSILRANGVLIELCPFDTFSFAQFVQQGMKIRWQLAFYKLCALYHCIRNYEYDFYCYMDTDVFVQDSFKRIWQEASYSVLLYDLNEPSDGYMVKEMQVFLNMSGFLTHYGGEFMAASKDLARQFIAACQQVYDEMLDSNYMTPSGDEFITSIAGSRMRAKVKNAGAYIRRYWTGSYRLLCNDYEKNNIVVLHMPAEKEQGIIALYDKYIERGLFPPKERVWRVCHLVKPSIRVRIGMILKKMGIVK